MSFRPQGPPAADEHAPAFGLYVGRVPETDLLAAMAAQHEKTLGFLRGLPAAKRSHRYAEGKWSVAEVIGHVTDAERIFAFRALSFARGEAAPLPGFDENAYVVSADFDAVPFAALVEGYDAVRRASLSLFSTMSPAAWAGRGVSNGKPLTVRALGYVIVGHERHHRAILAERYGI